MNREKCITSLVRQSYQAAAVTKALYESAVKACKSLDMEQYRNITKIYITGCGDSYCAALITKPIFEQLIDMDTDACRCIDFSRHYSSDDLKKNADSSLLIGISCSGNVSRVTEAMKRANALGIRTLAVTFNASSPVGIAADAQLCPVFPNDIAVLESPGSLSYNSSLMGMTAFAMSLAEIMGKLDSEKRSFIESNMFEYFDESQKVMDSFDEKAFQLAEKWADLRAFDFIGDYGDYATAFFSSAKVLEATGGKTTYDDSEDWCHINFFLNDPASIVRVVIANVDTPSFGRLKETLRTIEAIESPCLVVSDAGECEFPEGFEVVSFPKPSHFWMHAAMEHLAFDKIIGYIAGIKGADKFRRETPSFSNELVQDLHRIRESRIVVIE